MEKIKSKKIREVIEELNKEELEALYFLIQTGKLAELVKDKIRKKEKEGKKCYVCDAPIVDDFYELTWRTNDLTKRVIFEELDCLAYFVAILREKRNEVRKKEKKDKA